MIVHDTKALLGLEKFERLIVIKDEQNINSSHLYAHEMVCSMQ